MPLLKSGWEKIPEEAKCIACQENPPELHVLIAGRDLGYMCFSCANEVTMKLAVQAAKEHDRAYGARCYQDWRRAVGRPCSMAEALDVADGKRIEEPKEFVPFELHHLECLHTSSSGKSFCQVPSFLDERITYSLL